MLCNTVYQFVGDHIISVGRQNVQGLGGVEVAQITPDLADRFKLTYGARGVVVTDVSGQSRRLNLEPGDIVQRVNGIDIRKVADLVAATAENRRKWQMLVLRGSRTIRSVLIQ